MFEIRKRIVFKIEEETLQSHARANIGRELSEVELKRVCCMTLDDECFASTLNSELSSIIERAADPEHDWKEYDKSVAQMTLEQLLK